jgi:hypothetical protein
VPDDREPVRRHTPAEAFDQVFGSHRGPGPRSDAAAEKDAAEVRAWWERWRQTPGAQLDLIQHADGWLELAVRYSLDEDGEVMEDERYEWLVPVEDPVGQWLMDAVTRDGRLIAGWDYLAEQSERRK